MAAITLAKLLRQIQIKTTDERVILGISDDSRVLQKDWLFIARKGSVQSGADYITEALTKGAVVLWEGENKRDCYHCDNIIRAQTIILRFYYGDPSRHLRVIGVTGTNAKTSVSDILAQLLKTMKQRVMVIGTGAVRFLGREIAIDNTTPSACVLGYYFHQALKHHIPTVIMEVSSHAIDQERIGFIRFDAVIYTNIASDHLDYHITRTHYQYTKLKLRGYLKRNGILIVNHDDKSLHPLYSFHDHKVVTVGQGQAHFQISAVDLKASGSSFSLQNIPYEMRLLGLHNVYNTAQCLVVLHEMNVKRKTRQEAVKKLHPVSGRMETHEINHRYVIIDYAHTASSLSTLLQTVNQLKERKMIVICGCGGNRDRSKRSEMAQIASYYADTAIFTTDNPRHEPPYQILYDMIKGLEHTYEIFENRACAIKYAVKIAHEHDIIVIAGKGNEAYQVFNDKKYPFSDPEVLYRALEDNQDEY